MAVNPLAEDTVDLRVYLRFITGNAWLFVLFALLGSGIAFLMAARQTPIYEADAELVLVREAQPIAGVRQDLATYSPWDETFVHTHTRLVGSEKLVAAAAERIRQRIAPSGSRTAGDAPDAGLPPEPLPDLARWAGNKSADALAAEIQGGLSAGFIKKSRILNIRMRSASPAFAAAAVQALSEAYTEAVAEMSMGSSERLFARLQTERDEAARRMEKAANALLDFKRTAELDVLANADAAPAEAVDRDRTDAIRRQLVVENAEGTALLGQIAAVTHDIETLSQRYGEKHPEMKALADKRASLAAQRDALSDRLYQQWQLQHARERRQVQQDILEGEWESCRQMHDLILVKLKEVDLSARTADLSVLTLKGPTVPTRPVAPRTSRDTAMGALAGLCAAILLAMIREFYRTQTVSRDGLSSDLTVRMLGQIPFLPGRQDLPPLFSGQAAGPGAEAIRALRTSVLALLQETGGHLIQITSPGAGDGKSTLSAALARSLAMAGKKTLLLDLDLRRGHLHRLFGVSADRGLADILHGDDDPGPLKIGSDLWLYASGRRVSHSAELIMGERLERLFQAIESRYDVVIMDCPPLLAVTDASLLASHAQVRLLVARSRFTHRSACRDSVRLLESLGKPLHGVILNGVRRNEGSGYDYYYHSYHGRRPREGSPDPHDPAP